MNSENPQNELPPNLKAKLEQFRRAVWVVKIAEGLLAAIFGLALSYLLVFGLDRIWDTPQALRALILVVGASGLGFWFPTKCHRWVWERRSLEQVARLLRHKFPRLGDQLLGIVELARHSEGSQALVNAAFKQADGVVKEQNLSGAVPHAKHWHWGVVAGAVVAIVITAFVMLPKPSKNALERWLMPWTDTERYTFAQIGDTPDALIVPYAEPYDLNVVLSEQTDRRPANGVAEFEDQEAVNADLKNGAYDFEMPPRSKAGAVQVKVGDDREEISIKPTTRPELTGMSAAVHLPDYLRYSRDLEIEMRDGSVSLVKGSQATISGQVGRDLREASIDGEPLNLSGPTFATEPIFIDDSKRHELTWKDGYGLTAKQPVTLRINAREDEEPAVRAKLTSLEQVVLVSEAVNLTVEVSDDFGVREVGLEWVGSSKAEGGEPARGSKIVSAGAPEQLQVAGDAVFVAEREGVEPQTLQIAAYATDYLPGRERSYSRPFVIHVLSPEQHAMWLTEQLGKWFRQSQEVYEREKQLHATNKALRDMPAEQLDTDAARAQIASQAEAEDSNGKRLDALTKVGEELLEHGTRNDEFDADRLELWAKMIDQLEEIAKNRMPSVADMLASASEAQKGEPKEGEPGKPGESQPKPFGEKKEIGETRKNDEKGDSKKGGPPKSGPKVNDKESGFALTDKVGENPEEQKPGEPKPPGGSAGLKLPGTTLAKAPGENKPEEDSPAQEQTNQAVVEQTGLLEEFEEISAQLQDLLASLEASTFVKRLKAASREQMTVAGDLNSTLVGGFGMSGDELAEATRKVGDEIAVRETEESETVHLIQDDLEAYFHRKQDLRYKNILTQMQETSVVAELLEIGDEVRVNLNGRSIAAAEYWADTLDRWGEELVAASECKACKGEGNGDGLPPEVVLEVMKILHEEIQLREETRELEQAKAAMDSEKFGEKARLLSDVQKELRNRTYAVAKQIESMPQGARRFGKEIQLLSQVSQVMGEAKNILGRPNTGSEAIAAETEAIELLLQARRAGGGGGGGGGGNPGGGGGGTTGRSALAGVGEGADPGAHLEEREVGQATGKQGRELPEEFRSGLDAYFNELERGS
ncbi:MAG: hypothetical protein ACI8UO_001298 [Verrucomicrobiales bacterium]|jgi:hypothetical protein